MIGATKPRSDVSGKALISAASMRSEIRQAELTVAAKKMDLL